MIERLRRQTRPADRIVVVAVCDADLEGLSAAGPVEIHFGPRGSCHQRNHGLAQLPADAGTVVFFDDDFLPADDYLAEATALLRTRPEIAGATGRVIADGVMGPGITFEAAELLLAEDALATPKAGDLRPMRALYGCNMAIRGESLGNLRFDEALPLYAWQEDIDFSARVGRRGALVASDHLAGVHMGEKIGRTSGRRLGYSQIANPVYLMGKGTMPRDLALRNMSGNVAANLLRSLRPEPYVDRRGRLLGNLLAVRDHLTGRLDPRRILEMS